MSAPPTAEQTNVSPAQSYRHALDQDVAMTMLMEIQKSLGQIDTRINGLTSSVDDIKLRLMIL